MLRNLKMMKEMSTAIIIVAYEERNSSAHAGRNLPAQDYSDVDKN